MPLEDQLRLIMLCVFAVFAPIAFYYRLGSGTSERLDRTQEGTFIFYGLRLSAGPYLLGNVLWMLNPSWMQWSQLALPAPLRWAGVVLFVGWGLLVVWTFHHLGPNLTDTVVTRAKHTLITSGPYQYLRHPFYLAFALAVVSGFLVTANGLLACAGVIPIIFLYRRTRIEENKLIERFGQEYTEYMESTGRFWPCWRKPTGV